MSRRRRRRRRLDNPRAPRRSSHRCIDDDCRCCGSSCCCCCCCERRRRRGRPSTRQPSSPLFSLLLLIGVLLVLALPSIAIAIATASSISSSTTSTSPSASSSSSTRQQQKHRQNAFSSTSTSNPPNNNNNNNNNDKPNYVVIVCDQLRYDALGYVQAQMAHYDDTKVRVRTPNLDRLASRGISFQVAYTASPSCGPARASLKTGCTLGRTGLVSNQMAKESNLTRQNPIFRDRLERLVSYEQVLSQYMNYSVESYGKWHTDRSLYVLNTGHSRWRWRSCECNPDMDHIKSHTHPRFFIAGAGTTPRPVRRDDWPSGTRRTTFTTTCPSLIPP
jgi:Sulfatase